MYRVGGFKRCSYHRPVSGAAREFLKALDEKVGRHVTWSGKGPGEISLDALRELEQVVVTDGAEGHEVRTSIVRAGVISDLEYEYLRRELEPCDSADVFKSVCPGATGWLYKCWTCGATDHECWTGDYDAGVFTRSAAEEARLKRRSLMIQFRKGGQSPFGRSGASRQSGSARRALRAAQVSDLLSKVAAMLAHMPEGEQKQQLLAAAAQLGGAQ